MNKRTRFIVSALLVLASLAFWTTRTDIGFVRLSATEGQSNAVVLENNQTYTQTLAEAPENISRLGLFLRPAGKTVVPGEAVVTVDVNGRAFDQKIPTQFIDESGVTQVRFQPPIPVPSGARVRFTIQVPENLSGQIRAQLHEPSNTVAYEAYTRQRPPLAQALAIALLVGALFTLFPPISPALLLGIIVFVLAPWPLKIVGIPAALALHALHRFLGQSRLVNSLMYLVVILVYLELFHVRS